MALFFAPVANVVLSAVLPSEEGQASGANNAIREAGGVFGVAVLASVFGRYGGYESGQTFVDGLSPAIYGGAGVVLAGALAALAIPRLRAPPRSSRPIQWKRLSRAVPVRAAGGRSSIHIWKRRGRALLKAEQKPACHRCR
jgi:hypothetical protein